MKLQHIGILVKNIAKASRDFESLGYRALSPIIHDPIQTAYVQFLGLSSEIPQIELVQAEGPHSKLINALKKGGGLNHLCYEVSDIQAACEQFRDQGLLVLHAPIPAVAFNNSRVAWLMGRNGIPIELVEAEERQR